MAISSKLLVTCFVVIFALFQIVQPIAASAADKISQSQPQSLGTPEEDLSTLGSPPKKSKTWYWIGALVGVGLLAALAGGGGGGGGGDSSPTTTPAGGGDGSVSVGW